jgi:large subunit ribosomal protein L25
MLYWQHMTITLAVAKRDTTMSTKAVRQAMLLPAVVYGPKQTNESITIEKGVFEKLFKTAGESTIIQLTGLAKPIDVLVHSVDFSPMQGGIMHVDFYAVEKGKAITTNVSLELTGESEVEKKGGLISTVLHEVEVTCMPEVLPAHITIDISTLTEFDQKIHVSDLVLPKGVVVENPADEVLVIAVAPRVEVVSDEMPAEVVPEVPEPPAAA